MATGVFTLAAADILKDQIFPALIKNIEIREGGSSDASQYQSLGRVIEGKLNLKAATQKSAGTVPTQVGYFLELSVVCATGGTNFRTAVNKIIANFAECRLTDVNGHKYTFIGGATAEMDLTIEEEIAGDGGDSGKITITGGGYITNTRYTALFSLT